MEAITAIDGVSQVETQTITNVEVSSLTLKENESLIVLFLGGNHRDDLRTLLINVFLSHKNLNRSKPQHRRNFIIKLNFTAFITHFNV